MRVTLFGNFGLCAPDGSEVTLTIKRARALLGILCLEPGTAWDREKLCTLLWGGRFRAQARASLRQTLLGLKKQLTPFRDDIFEVTRETVAVNPSAIRSDLAELEAELAGGGRAVSCCWRSATSRCSMVSNSATGSPDGAAIVARKWSND